MMALANIQEHCHQLCQQQLHAKVTLGKTKQPKTTDIIASISDTQFVLYRLETV